jgi:hypothetical protein
LEGIIWRRKQELLIVKRFSVKGEKRIQHFVRLCVKKREVRIEKQEIRILSDS